MIWEVEMVAYVNVLMLHDVVVEPVVELFSSESNIMHLGRL